jgi:hypothetical protein
MLGHLLLPPLSRNSICRGAMSALAIGVMRGLVTAR